VKKYTTNALGQLVVYCYVLASLWSICHLIGRKGDVKMNENREMKLLRLKQVLAPLGPVPVSKSSWYAGIAKGIYPKPVRVSARISAWRADEIAALITNMPRAS
jgi:prophage regulatory protein